MHKVRTAVSAMALVLALAAAAQAQSNEERLQEKLKEPFVSNAQWVTDYAQAMELAKKENKVILAYFTRSYAP